MPNLWERTHERVLDNELRKAQRRYEAEIIQHGRFMALIGLIVGLLVGSLL